MTDYPRPTTLQEAALKYGTFMGLFWTLKFALVPMGFHSPSLHLLYIVFTLFVPVLGYLYARNYRRQLPHHALRFSEGFLFAFIMYMAATMLTFLVHYVYFRYVDNGFLVEAYRAQMESARDMAQGEMIALFDESLKVFEELADWTSVERSFWLAWQNLFYCFPLSLITALCVRSKGMDTDSGQSPITH